MAQILFQKNRFPYLYFSMNLKYSIFLIAAIIFATFTSGWCQEEEYIFDCFSVVVGKNASTDGSVLFAHNEDTGMKLVNTYKVPAALHKEGEIITLEAGGKVPQVAKTYGYLWINMPGISVCDTYLNEAGVAIGSDGCPSKEENPELTDGGILFWLRRIVAERAGSSREGVKIAGELIDQFGYNASGRTYIIADADEAWNMAVVNGKHWVAQRIPDDEIMVIPNYYTIGEIDLDDTLNFMGSGDIVEYALQQGWYDPNTDGAFHFARAYSNPGSLKHRSNIRRKWRGLTLLSGHTFRLDDELPFSVKPQNKISVQDLTGVLRDHYEGSSLDSSKMYTLGSPYDMNGSMIGARSTQYGAIAQLRKNLPREIASVLWLAPYRPDVQAFIPWYPSITKVPAIYGQNSHSWALENQFNPPEMVFNQQNNHAFWTFVKLVDQVDKNYLVHGQEVKTIWSKFEGEVFEFYTNLETSIQKKLKRSRSKAIEILTDSTAETALKAYEAARKITGI